MRVPANRPALRVQPTGAGEEELESTEDSGAAYEAPPEEDTSTPASRRLHDLIIQLGRYRSLRDPLHGICESNQLTPTQIHVLMWLGNDGPTHVGVLAQRVGITKKTITGVVDRLEDMKMVERTRDAEDRRAVVAQLTPEGVKLFTLISRSVDQGLRRMLDLLPPDDQEALFGLLERVLKRLGTTPEQAI
ncbi:MarR family transcriptional regulator [Myxococcus sp. MISCRS1]|jgi:DNA-binding MarR family transcriptional regulator|uniref:MarR family winged helix-turn-helix transcriptional regulator n=1 Tax=Myxococcus TaxID=32 RepID=UPI0011425E71|nr:MULTISPECIES: MarR family transcriptional regulator [Myxococcus]BDT33949.1 MarR family transcriptional regulator [Myxococcus sp. MH1]MBZ4400012.1 MarR family transcriptional regulator [Myxococcus sp. AS-1-15]MBZ4412307.1 MarR family transcriptional regulator [Myxococcus sp. XM-1-1-1]MCK8496748.1 MarR family transcriptional regulator [Myxococcus fulvus]MCY0996068.1 MarR family transcriptional regulator [Myxococcus sp. MISCRS1]